MDVVLRTALTTYVTALASIVFDPFLRPALPAQSWTSRYLTEWPNSVDVGCLGLPRAMPKRQQFHQFCNSYFQSSKLSFKFNPIETTMLLCN
jgi:hypothetical protein